MYSSVPDLSGLFWENLYNDSAQMVLDSFSQLGNTNSGSSVRAWKSGRTGPDARRGEGVDVFSFHTSTLPYIHTRTRPQADGHSTSCFRIRDKSEQWHSSVPGGGGTGRRNGLVFERSSGNRRDVIPQSQGTLSDGNPEPSPRGTVQRLDGERRVGEEKVQLTSRRKP